MKLFSFNLSIVLFWTVGLVITGHSVYKSWTRFFRFETDFDERFRFYFWKFFWKFLLSEIFSHDGTTFPKLTLCAKSIHSRQKLASKYPKLSLTMLKQFYGTATSAKEKADWTEHAMSGVSFKTRDRPGWVFLQFY